MAPRKRNSGIEGRVLRPRRKLELKTVQSKTITRHENLRRSPRLSTSASSSPHKPTERFSLTGQRTGDQALGTPRSRRDISHLTRLDTTKASCYDHSNVSTSQSPGVNTELPSPISPTTTPESVSSILAKRKRQCGASAVDTHYSVEDHVRNFMHNIYAELDDACVKYGRSVNPGTYSFDAYDIVCHARQYSVEKNCFKQEDPAQTRYLKAALFGEEVGWITLIICVHCPSFIKEFLFCEAPMHDDLQTAISICLERNKTSIGMYAQTRHLNWQDVLRLSSRLLEKCTPSRRPLKEQESAIAKDKSLHEESLALPSRAKHPHEVHLDQCDRCQRNTAKSPSEVLLGPHELPGRISMVNIEWYTDPFPEDVLWRGRQNWPINYPLFRTQDQEETEGKTKKQAKCYLCQDEGKPNLPNPVRDEHPEAFCNCTIADLEPTLIANGLYYTKSPGRLPRVEMTVSSRPDCGIGVRALQHFPKDTFLGLFLGELHATNPGPGFQRFPAIDRGLGTAHGLYGNSEYHFEITDFRKPGNRRGMGTERAFGVVDPTKYGNWPRYVNHSCAPNTTFAVRPIGKLAVVTVEACQDIACGDEITIDYGPDYFQGRLDCLCGEDSCRLWDAKQHWPKKGRSPITLGEARRRGLK